MPKLTINGTIHDIPTGERLVLAIERAGVPIGHRCGGQGACTSCRVRFLSGEPDTITEAEFKTLAEEGLWQKARLACQIEVTGDMALEVLDPVAAHPEWSGDPGPEPEEWVTPESVWYPMEDLK